MPHYMFQVAYTPEAWEGLVRRPQDRARAIRPIVKNLKGRVISFYNSFGDDDVVLIAEMPNNEAAAGLSMAAAAGGAILDRSADGRSPCRDRCPWVADVRPSGCL